MTRDRDRGIVTEPLLVSPVQDAIDAQRTRVEGKNGNSGSPKNVEVNSSAAEPVFLADVLSLPAGAMKWFDSSEDEEVERFSGVRVTIDHGC